MVYVVSGVDGSRQLEQTALRLRQKAKIVFLLLNKRPGTFQMFLEAHQIPVRRFSPERPLLPIACILLVLYFLLRRPKVVHAHLFDAGVVGLTAAWLARVPQRMYTRHHSTIHHQYFRAGLKWDKLCNKLATAVVAPSKTVQDVLTDMEGVPGWKVALVHHGFALSSLAAKPDDARLEKIRTKYRISDRQGPVIGCVARYTEWKGVQYVIEAFGELIKSVPSARLVLANAKGDYCAAIKHSLSQLPSESFREIEFEEDVEALYHLFDVLVHVPIDGMAEAFGQVYVEAMAAGVPMVVTLSGIAKECVVDEKNALVVPFKDPSAIEKAIRRLLEQEELRREIILNAQATAQNFSLDIMLDKLTTLYK